MTAAGGYVPLVRVMRSGAVESVHHGAVVVLRADGEIDWSIGDADAWVFPRSANKPMQGLAMSAAGLVLPSDLLALACASHLGEPVHLDGVRRLLARAGLTEDDLENTPDQSAGIAARDDRIRAGLGPAAVAQNCSGKHAAMLVTCVMNGWPTRGYLAPDHPLQQLVTSTIAELIGRPDLEAGVDGCGAPAHRLGLRELAWCYSQLASGAAGPAGLAIRDAMGAHPELVGGTGHDVTGFLRGVPGLLVKDGAEGVYAAALPDGRAMALKIADGAARARPVVVAAVLAAWGIDVAPLREVWDIPVLGHGRPVGRVEAMDALRAPSS